MSDESFYHEAYHYQQLISTPFGFHLALIDWNAVFRGFRWLRDLAGQGANVVFIPLADYLRKQAAISVDLSGLEEVVSFKLYANLHLDVGFPTLVRRLGYEALADGLRFALLLLARMGGESAVAAIEQFHPPTPGGEEPPYFIGGIEVTARDIMENSATVASAVLGGDRSHDTEIGTAISMMRRKTPHRYTYLLRQFAELCPRDYPILPFAHAFGAIADLAFSGDLCPFMPGFGAASARWIDILPVPRFCRVFERLKAKPDLRAKVFASDPSEMDMLPDVLGDLADSLDWARPSSLWTRVDWSQYGCLRRPPFCWIIDEVERAFRKRQESRLLSMPEAYILAFSTVIQDFDPLGKPSFQDRLTEELTTEFERSVMRPPLMLHKTGDDLVGATAKLAAYSALWYHTSHFLDRMVFHRSLEYPVELLPKDELGALFSSYSGFDVQQVLPWPT
jgi:hypothetical protein